MNEETFTLDEIQKAFWKTFHRSGEHFFEYQTDDEHEQACTLSVWNEFSDNLPIKTQQ